MSQRSDILNLTMDELSTWLNQYDIKSYRAKQVAKWIYFCQADRFDVMTDLGKNIRSLLTKHFFIGRLKTAKIAHSSDG